MNPQVQGHVVTCVARMLQYVPMTLHKEASFFKAPLIVELVLDRHLLYNLFVGCHPRCQQNGLAVKCLKCSHHIKCHAALSLSSPLRAMVAASALDPGQPEPQLQGQTQATAQPNGTISISELSLLARPGAYKVSVTLPDYPVVSILPTGELFLL